MIRFHQTFGAHAGRIAEHDGDVVSFGRMPDCDISFDPQADLDASGRHAEVRKASGGWQVVDTGSRNGTWLNGQKVQQAMLSSGDELEFGMGGPRVRVEIVADGPAPGREVTGPMTPAPGMAGIDVSAPTVAAMATPTPPVAGGASFDLPTAQETPNPAARAPASHATGPATPIAGGFGGGMGAGTGTPPPPASTPPASGSPKQYGERTVGLMIQAALAQAGGPQKGGHSTDEIRAIAQSAASAPPPRASGGLKIIIAVLVLLLVVVIVGSGVALYVMSRGTSPTAIAGDPPPAVDVEAAALGITTASGGALFVLVEAVQGSERGVCAAFAVRPDLLATTAQCVLQMQEGRARQATHSAVPNGNAGQRLLITQMWHHPGFVAGQSSADVGIVQVAGSAAAQVPLASMAELAELEVHAPVFLFGFSGDLQDVGAPVAVLGRGQVLGMSAFDGSPAAFPTAQVLQHDAQRGVGSRGGPIFAASGRAVGIETGTTGVRIDLLSSLLAGMSR